MLKQLAQATFRDRTKREGEEGRRKNVIRSCLLLELSFNFSIFPDCCLYGCAEKLREQDRHIEEKGLLFLLVVCKVQPQTSANANGSGCLLSHPESPDRPHQKTIPASDPNL